MNLAQSFTRRAFLKISQGRPPNPGYKGLHPFAQKIRHIVHGIFLQHGQLETLNKIRQIVEPMFAANDHQSYLHSSLSEKSVG